MTRGSRRWVGAGLAALVAAGACTPAGGGRGMTGTGGPSTAAGASVDVPTVLARIREALDRGFAHGGRMVLAGPHGSEPTVEFAVAANGDHRAAGAYGWHSFDAERGVLRVYCRAEDTLVEVTGVMGGRPHSELGHVSPGEPAGISRTALGLESAVPRPTTHDGKPAWRFDGPVAHDMNGADHVAVTVDPESGLGVMREGFADGLPVSTLRIEELVVGEAPGLEAIDMTVPPTARLVSVDGGFRVGDPAEAGAASLGDYAAGDYTVDHVPDGFVLTSRSHAEDPAQVPRAAQAYAITGRRLLVSVVMCLYRPMGTQLGEVEEDSPSPIPPPSELHTLTYRRGFRAFTVSVATYARATYASDAATAIPAGLGASLELGGSVYWDQAVMVEAGALGDAPMLVGRFRDTVVTIAGDLDTEELISVAGSLRPLQ